MEKILIVDCRYLQIIYLKQHGFCSVAHTIIKERMSIVKQPKTLSGFALLSSDKMLVSMRKINFARGQWNSEEFRYVYSARFKPTPIMRQENDCIVNGLDSATGDYEYISLVTEKMYAMGTTIETRCSFESYGAPLIVFSDDFYKGENGEWYFGVHYEVVLYEGGINVWELNLNKDVMKWENLLRLKFPVNAKKVHLLSVKILEKALDITMEGMHVVLGVKDLPKEFRVGITACEGINRFYTCNIKEENLMY